MEHILPRITSSKTANVKFTTEKNRQPSNFSYFSGTLNDTFFCSVQVTLAQTYEDPD
jgi:hypothetical protein